MRDRSVLAVRFLMMKIVSLFVGLEARYLSAAPALLGTYVDIISQAQSSSEKGIPYNYCKGEGSVGIFGAGAVSLTLA